jgi:hypothetical protein
MAPEREDAKHFDNRVNGIRAKTKITLTSHWSKVAGGVIPLHKLSIHMHTHTHAHVHIEKRTSDP